MPEEELYVEVEEKQNSVVDNLINLPIWFHVCAFFTFFLIYRAWKNHQASSWESLALVFGVLFLAYVISRSSKKIYAEEYLTLPEQCSNVYTNCKSMRLDTNGNFPDGIIQIDYLHVARPEFNGSPSFDYIPVNILQGNNIIKHLLFTCDPKRGGRGIVRIDTDFKGYPEGMTDNIRTIIPLADKLQREWQMPGFLAKYMKGRKGEPLNKEAVV